MANQGVVNAAGDIEGQLPDNVAAASSTNSDHPNAHASPIQQNPNITTGQDDVCSCKGFLASPISLLRTLIITVIPHFMWIIVRALSWSFITILYPPVAFCIIIVTGDTDWLYNYGYTRNYSREDENKKKGSRIKMKKAAIKVKIHRLTILTEIRMGCLVLLWMVINLTVENLRRVTVLGSLLWKWSLLASLILLAHPFLMSLLNCISAVFIRELFSSYGESNMEYYMEGIAEGLILALYFTSLLLAWLLCVDTANAQLHRYGTLTLVSLLVGGVLSLLKSSVLLWWRTKLIYVKYKAKILLAGCYLFFNLLLTDQVSDYGILVDWLIWSYSTPRELVPIEPKSQEREDHKVMPNRRKILPIEEYMLKSGASIKNVHEVATYLTNNFELSLTEDDDIPDIVPYLQRNFRIGPGPGYSLAGVGKLSATLLKELLQLETPEENPPYEDFEKWMVDGLRYFYAVGNRIDGAFEVMRILNRVMTAFIIVVVILVWLFITGLATTKVVVGLASVFLGLSFIFGDACKTFFQGVIFSFVTHPFDVADRCVIDDKELKVKKISILTTTFFGSQSKEIVLYPNSDLATKRIMLLHGERESESKPERKVETQATLDLKDFVEFSLPPQTTSLQMESLQDTVERHLEGGVESGAYKNSYWVSLIEFGDSIKMRVNFEHVLQSGGINEHLESVEMRKHKQRSKLFIQLKKLVEDLGK